MGVRPS